MCSLTTVELITSCCHMIGLAELEELHVILLETHDSYSFPYSVETSSLHIGILKLKDINNFRVASHI